MLRNAFMHVMVTAVFECGARAEQATHELERSGFARQDISVLASDSPYEDEEAQRDDAWGPVLIGVSAPEDRVDVTKQLLRCSGATRVEVH